MVKNPFDVFGVVDVIGVVEHRRTHGEGGGYERLLGLTGDAKAVELGTVGGEIGVSFEAIDQIVHAENMTGVEVDDNPVGSAGDSHPFAVDELEFAESEETVGAARPSADCDLLVLGRQARHIVVHTAQNPSLALGNELTEAHVEGFDMMVGGLLEEAGSAPDGDAVVHVAEVVRHDELVGIIHKSSCIE